VITGRSKLFNAKDSIPILTKQNNFFQNRKKHNYNEIMNKTKQTNHLSGIKWNVICSAYGEMLMGSVVVGAILARFEGRVDD
jgi:hypothetical protein